MRGRFRRYGRLSTTAERGTPSTTEVQANAESVRVPIDGVHPGLGSGVELADGREVMANDMSRRFLVGASIGSVVFLLVILAGRLSLLQQSPTGDFYDVQARSFFRGTWEVPSDRLGIEAFDARGGTRTYFGPFPALLRMPVFALTDRFDGRLSQLSMVLAFVCVVLSVALLVKEIVVRVDLVGSRLTSGMFAALGLAVTAGSVVTFLGFRAEVYNEAISWGMATTLAATAALLRGLRTADRRLIVVAGLLATAAVQSRITVGASAVAALAVPALVGLIEASRRVPHDRIVVSVRLRPVLAASVMVPVLVFVLIQYAKWGQLLVYPSQHIDVAARPVFQAYIAANGNSFFTPAFVPANFLNSIIWPSAVDFGGSFPWVRPVDTAFGPSPLDPVFMGRNWTGSLLFTQTLLFVLACIGIVALYRPPLRARHSGARGAEAAPSALSDLRLVVPGLGVGLAATLAYSYQYHRYLGDSIPLIVVAAITGVTAVARVPTAKIRRLIASVIVLLLVWNVWINLSLAVLAQTDRGWKPSPSALEQIITIRELTGGLPPIERTNVDDPVPSALAAGSLLIIGDCEALLATAGQEGFDVRWWPVSLGPAFKRELVVDVDAAAPASETIVSSGSNQRVELRPGAGSGVLVARADDVERSIPLGGGLQRVVFEMSPVHPSLTIRVGDKTASIPWHGALVVNRGSGGFVQDRGGDDMSMCSRLSS